MPPVVGLVYCRRSEIAELRERPPAAPGAAPPRSRSPYGSAAECDPPGGGRALRLTRAAAGREVNFLGNNYRGGMRPHFARRPPAPLRSPRARRLGRHLSALVLRWVFVLRLVIDG
ncbi:hypothetical protein EVAR_46454_1 [Eumeta japonica]|uniref:Uncharacterized protein n=1 Tax=Eumeta variegata TaxID=151549 RepID=A0A4C1XK81_EUMVA|nr:hypothetical protein EVAR_46454_1 [Eumeta japonica]